MVFLMNPGCCCGGCNCYTDYISSAHYLNYVIRFTSNGTQDTRNHAINTVTFLDDFDVVSGGIARVDNVCPWGYNAGLLQTGNSQKLKIYSGAEYNPYTATNFDDMGGRSGVLFSCGTDGEMTIIDSSGTVTSGGNTYTWSNAICPGSYHYPTGVGVGPVIENLDLICDGNVYLSGLPDLSTMGASDKFDVTISGCTDLGGAPYSDLNTTHTMSYVATVGGGVTFAAPVIGGFQLVGQLRATNLSQEPTFFWLRANPQGFYNGVYFHYSALNDQWISTDDISTIGGQIPDRSGGQVVSATHYT